MLCAECRVYCAGSESPLVISTEEIAEALVWHGKEDMEDEEVVEVEVPEVLMADANVLALQQMRRPMWVPMQVGGLTTMWLLLLLLLLTVMLLLLLCSWWLPLTTPLPS